MDEVNKYEISGHNFEMDTGMIILIVCLVLIGIAVLCWCLCFCCVAGAIAVVGTAVTKEEME